MSDAAHAPPARRDAPSAEAPPYGYAEFGRRAARQRRRRAWRRRFVLGLPAIALASVFAIAWWAGRDAGEREVERDQSQTRRLPLALVDQAWLEALPEDRAVVRVDTRLAAARLEDRIAWIDDLLSDSQASGDPAIRIHELRMQRAKLVDSLVRVRYAEELVLVSR